MGMGMQRNNKPSECKFKIHPEISIQAIPEHEKPKI